MRRSVCAEENNVYRQIVLSNLKCLIPSDRDKLLVYPKTPAECECESAFFSFLLLETQAGRL